MNPYVKASMLINCFNIKPPTVDMSAVRSLVRNKLYYSPFLRNKIAWKIWHAKGTNSIEWERSSITHILLSMSLILTSRAGWICGWAVCQHFLSSLDVNLPQVLTSTPPPPNTNTHTHSLPSFMFLCRTSWDRYRLGWRGSIGPNLWRIVTPPTIVLPQTISHAQL